jgi:hypothetical protein
MGTRCVFPVQVEFGAAVGSRCGLEISPVEEQSVCPHVMPLEGAHADALSTLSGELGPEEAKEFRDTGK